MWEQSLVIGKAVELQCISIYTSILDKYIYSMDKYIYAILYNSMELHLVMAALQRYL